MPRVSFRTLTLMLLLLASVVTHQYVSWAPTAHADVIWLADDDPNAPSEPQPEVSATLGLYFLDDDPNEPSEPQPEMAAWTVGLCSDDDPNEPQPEMAAWIVGLYSDDDPNEPQPEMAAWAVGLYSDDDPNEPSEPQPEVA
jgi:hypothetical protein